MVLTLLAVGFALLLAFANGANDNFKGVATLFGSGVSNYRQALTVASVATFAGSVAAIGLTAHLVAAFSGKLFVAPEVLLLPEFPVAVCAAAGGTVLLATAMGLPISTTHALAGALLGAAAAAMPDAVNWSKAGTSIFLPLAVSPLLSMTVALLLYAGLHRLRGRMGIRRQSCICIGEAWVPAGDGSALRRAALQTGETPQCMERYSGTVWGLQAGQVIDALHYLSAATVSFARGLNDTPKLVALTLLGAPLIGASVAFGGVGLLILAGGLLAAYRVAQTLSHGVTRMNPGQGLTANLTTSALVLVASPMGLPVSTTHVSCGALFGIGAVTGQARWRIIAGIVGAWLVTLPLSAAAAALLLLLFRTF